MKNTPKSTKSQVNKIPPLVIDLLIDLRKIYKHYHSSIQKEYGVGRSALSYHYKKDEEKNESK